MNRTTANSEPRGSQSLWRRIQQSLLRFPSLMARSGLRLGSQISFLVATSLLLMVVSVSFVTYLLADRRLADDYKHYASAVADMLADNASLAALVRSPEAARQAIEIASSFDTVSRVAVYEKSGEMLAGMGVDAGWPIAMDDLPSTLLEGYLERDTQQYWQYVTPIFSDTAEPELEDQEATREAQTLEGYLRIRVRKDHLFNARDNIVFANFMVLLTAAVFLLLALRLLTIALTRPLEDFVRTMRESATTETHHPRTDLKGSLEVSQLSESFNRMMAVLQERELELAETRDQALTAAQLKSEFAANVSHEIRTPLNGIVGTLNLLSESSLSKEQREYIGLAESASEGLVSMINDILEFSRLSLDESTLVQQAFDLRSLLEELLALHARSYDKKKLDFLFHYDPALPDIVESDANKIRQLLNNLLNNAVKFTEQGAIELRAEKQSDAEGKVWINIMVRDSGIGLSESELRSIFLPYQQTDGTMSRKYGGTGLGLAICEKLAELLHGDIGVNSTPGKGSDFYVRIPFVYQQAERSRLASFDKVRVLVFSEEPKVIASIENLCQRAGLDCRTALTLEKIQEQLDSAKEDGRETLLIAYPSAAMDELPVWQQLDELLDGRQLQVLRVSRINPSQHRESVRSSLCLPPLRTMNVFAVISEMFAPESVPVSTGSSGAERAVLKDRKILLVEDNPINRRVAEAMLEKAGCDLAIAEDGEQALLCLQQQGFDAILMDCQMPGLNGYDTTRAIRAQKGDRANVPIIAMTANVDMQERIHCFEVGMNDFIGKPMRLNDLYAVLGKWVLRSSSDWQPPASPELRRSAKQ